MADDEGAIVGEEYDERGLYLPKYPFAVPFSELLKRAISAPGRYTSPRKLAETLMLKYHEQLSSVAPATQSVAFLDPLYPIPPQWQAIFEYLFEEGLITSPRVVIERLYHDVPKFFSLRLFSVFDANATDGRPPASMGYSRGVSLDFEEALSKVIGEFLERYPLVLYRRDNMVRASMRDLERAGHSFLDPHDVAGFSEWQKELYPGRRFSDESIFFWQEGLELISGTKAFIPSQLIFWNYDTMKEPIEPYLRQPITNGAAGHFTRTEAIIAAIYEIIQRDAFLVHWLKNAAPARIVHDSIENPALRETLEQFRRYGFEVTLLDTTLDTHVPSCACVLVDSTGRGPKLAVGGGCGPSMEHSLMRSITEAYSVYHWLRSQPGEPMALPDEYEPFRDPSIRQDSRLLLWGEDKMLARFMPFISGREVACRGPRAGDYPASFGTPEDELAYLLDIFRTKGTGYEVYVYEAHHTILQTLGYSSVRVVIPAMVPLYMSEQDVPLGSERLTLVPRVLGWNSAEGFNPWPHPFP